MWEDDASKNLVKWIMHLRKGLASRFWENIILAMQWEQFLVGEDLCWLVVSIQFQEDILPFWNKKASNLLSAVRIWDKLQRVLNLEYHHREQNSEWERERQLKFQKYKSDSIARPASSHAHMTAHTVH